LFIAVFDLLFQAAFLLGFAATVVMFFEQLVPYFCANRGGFYSITQIDKVSNR
jgi:hypothetical protein